MVFLRFDCGTMLCSFQDWERLSLTYSKLAAQVNHPKGFLSHYFSKTLPKMALQARQQVSAAEKVRQCLCRHIDFMSAVPVFALIVCVYHHALGCSTSDGACSQIHADVLGLCTLPFFLLFLSLTSLFSTTDVTDLCCSLKAAATFEDAEQMARRLCMWYGVAASSLSEGKISGQVAGDHKNAHAAAVQAATSRLQDMEKSQKILAGLEE